MRDGEVVVCRGTVEALKLEPLAETFSCKWQARPEGQPQFQTPTSSSVTFQSETWTSKEMSSMIYTMYIVTLPS